ncbi:MAG: diguanylate cyclase [Desulfuromonadaceae bacterium]|nr:diguanylate cyclase [Desulfuromonadaceae bacterium]
MPATGPSVLIVHSSAALRQQIAEALRTASPFEAYYSTDQLPQARQLLEQHDIDVILCELELQPAGATDLLRQLSQEDELRDIPMIVLTRNNQVEKKIELLELGAGDYVVLPFDIGELVARVKVQLKMKTTQDNLKRSNRLLLNLSSTDSLTRLYNRRMLIRTLNKEFDRSLRSHTSLSLLMLDIDFFKRINDSFGHLNGDHVLVTVAGLLRKHLRPYDVATRYGGEEFALVLPDTDGDQARLVAERLRQAVEQQTWPGEMCTIQITVSIGIASIPAADINNIDELLQRADDALYQAKEQGRNRVCHHQSAQNAATAS